jgi:hypothetical protein
MGAVAVGGIAGILAATKERGLRPLSGKHERLNAGACMRPIAKWLLLAPPAAAPGVSLAGFKLDLIGAELRPFRL